MRRLEARRWVLRNTRLPSHSAKTRTVPRTQAWMRRMRLMRACRSISKDNGGTELPFSDIGSSYVAAQRGTIVGRWLRLLDGGSHTAAVVTRESLTADEMSGLKPTCSVSGDFLEIYSKGYAATVPIAVGYLTRRDSAQRLSFRVADFSVRRLKKEPRKLRHPDYRAPPGSRTANTEPLPARSSSL